MQSNRDFDYYKNLHTLISHALLHLLCQVSASPRYCPTTTRNAILRKYLKVKLKDRKLVNIKNDIKLMLATARHKSGNLERKLYELNDKSNQLKLAGQEKLYALLVYLFDHEGIESRLFNEDAKAEPGILYIIEDHLEHCFNSEGKQIAPISMLIQSERSPELIDIINKHGRFMAELKEWNAMTNQAHILIHPIILNVWPTQSSTKTKFIVN